MKKEISQIKFLADSVLRREIMEHNSQNFTEMVDKVCNNIITLCERIEKTCQESQQNNGDA